MRTVDQNISAVVPLLGSTGVCPASGVGIVQVPSFLFSSRTTLSGYLGTFFHGIVSIALICLSLSFPQGSPYL